MLTAGADGGISGIVGLIFPVHPILFSFSIFGRWFVMTEILLTVPLKQSTNKQLATK